MFIAALLTVVERWKQLGVYQWTNRETKDGVYIQ